MTKHYSNGEITVIWKPDICQHSGICARGLPAVLTDVQIGRASWTRDADGSTDAIDR